MTVAGAIEAGAENAGYAAGANSASPGGRTSGGAFILSAGKSATGIEAPSVPGSIAAKNLEFRAQWKALFRAPVANDGAVEDAGSEASLETNLGMQSASVRVMNATELLPQQSAVAAFAANAAASKATAANSAGGSSPARMSEPENLLRNGSLEAAEARSPSGSAARETSSDAAGWAAGPVKKTRDGDAAKGAGQEAWNAAAQAESGAVESTPWPVAAVPAVLLPDATASPSLNGNSQSDDDAIGGGNASATDGPASPRMSPAAAAAQSLALEGNLGLSGSKPNAGPNAAMAGMAARAPGEKADEFAGGQSAEETEGIPGPAQGVASAVAEKEKSAVTAAPVGVETPETNAAAIGGREFSASGAGAETASKATVRGSSERRTVATASPAGGSSSGNPRLVSDEPLAATPAARHEPADGSLAPFARDKLTSASDAGAHLSAMRAAPAASPLATLATPDRIDASGMGSSLFAGGSSKDVFAALDSGSGVGAPTLIHAGSQRAEAGFEDPTLGWVGVRADLAGSGIHATLMPGSAEAAQVLSAHMAGLSAHLSEQHTPVSTLSMAHPGQSGFASGMDDGRQQESNRNDGQSSSTAAPVSEHSVEQGTTHADFDVDFEAQRTSGAQAGLPSLDGMRGGRISVMA